MPSPGSVRYSDRAMTRPACGIARGVRGLLLAGGVLALAGLAWLGLGTSLGGPGGGGGGPSIQVLERRDGEPSEGLPFRYQPFAEPRLQALGRREGLDAVVGGTPGEFARILRLKDWLAAQWPQGEPDPYPPWDALEILDWIRSGRTGGYCAQYSQVFVQALAYLGLTARYVEVGTRENPTAHYPVEVWSNEHDRWVLLDVDYNLHFERRGMPLSALEVHEALLRGEAGALVPVLGTVRAGHRDPHEWPLGTAELYYYLRFHLKADHLTRPGDPFNRWDGMVEWEDPRVVPWKERLTRRRTRRPEDAYAKLNQVRITPRRLTGNVLEVALEQNVFGFEAYEVARGLSPAAWEPHRADALRWTLVPGENVLRVRGRNLRGVTGPVATLKVLYRPGA